MLTDPAACGDHTDRTDTSRDSTPAPAAVPDFLEPFVVDQDPTRYSAEDQAVWRFVLLALMDRLKETAHPSYTRGLLESGISSERIPSVAEMNRCLGRLGWGAVCVDGFIPPRAFQGFQARGILPIAAEMRTVEQLPYTPAPDIIHEAAGHAPILVDPQYAAYIRAIGGVGSRAFSSAADARVDAAVRCLSDIKERSNPDPAELAAAERELVSAYAAADQPSEAARMSRLYWWTAEYGLVGTPRDYRLYGAGLLSSLGESHFCHMPEVAKLVLSPACTSVAYDITRQQPQLFVARDFEHLGEVLAAVENTLAYRIGGRYALDMALQSQELCSVRFGGAVDVIGTLRRVLGGAEPAAIELAAGSALHCSGQLLACPDAYFVPFGALADGTRPQALTPAELRRRAAGGRATVQYASGVVASGVPCAPRAATMPGIVELAAFRLEWQGRVLCETPGPYPLLLTDVCVTAAAGASADGYWQLGAEHAQPRAARPTVPKPKRLGAAAERRNAAYHELARAPRGIAGNDVSLAGLEALHAQLNAEAPHDWLLRWNLLERALAGHAGSALVSVLERELVELEAHYAGQFPIKLGLEALKRRVARS